VTDDDEPRMEKRFPKSEAVVFKSFDASKDRYPILNIDEFGKFPIDMSLLKLRMKHTLRVSNLKSHQPFMTKESLQITDVPSSRPPDERIEVDVTNCANLGKRRSNKTKNASLPPPKRQSTLTSFFKN